MGFLATMGTVLGSIILGVTFIVILNLTNAMWAIYHRSESIIRLIHQQSPFAKSSQTRTISRELSSEVRGLQVTSTSHP